MTDTTTTTPRAHGIHHVTAIVGDAQRTIDFYAGVLGLRLVKRTVNFDDPTTYHLYFGDATGAPGTILTFFPWANAHPGQIGLGQSAVTAFAVPAGSIGWWLERLVALGVSHDRPTRRFAVGDAPGETVVALRDPDGLLLELVGVPGAASLAGWESDGVPAAHAIRGFHGVTLWVDAHAPTEAILAGPFGFRLAAEEGSVRRWVAAEETEDGGPAPAGIARVVDVRAVPDFFKGVSGVGTVHHVAFRVRDDAEELAVRTAVTRLGFSATPQLDRNYFHSVYFREPGGVLFELATDAPGFLVDEPFESLGESLKLPPQYEPHRAMIETALPKVRLPRRGAPTAADSAFHDLPAGAAPAEEEVA